jgi:hypothetical protein
MILKLQSLKEKLNLSLMEDRPHPLQFLKKGNMSPRTLILKFLRFVQSCRSDMSLCATERVSDPFYHFPVYYSRSIRRPADHLGPQLDRSVRNSR